LYILYLIKLSDTRYIFGYTMYKDGNSGKYNNRDISH
jgi:hypothetical protein